MTNLRYVLFAGVAALVMNSAIAGDQLGKKDVVKLLSGNTVYGYYIKEAQQQGLKGRVRLEIKFFDDGSAEKTTTMAKSTHGQFTEKGKWFVNKRGKLCLVWKPDNKKRCGKLLRTPDGKYELHRKQQKFFYEEIVSGN